MIIRCDQCNTAFKLDDQLIKPEGIKVQCAKCQHVFPVKPSKPIEPTAPVTVSPAPPTHHAPPQAKTPPPETETPKPTPETAKPPERPAEPPVETRPESPLLSDDALATTTPAPEAPPETAAPADEGSEDALPEVREEKTTEKIKVKRKKRTTFRARLMGFAFWIIGVIAAIVVPVESYRPVQELHRLINNAKSLIAGIHASMDPAELGRMNEFALVTINRDLIQNEERRNYYFLSFNMMITEGDILSEEEILKQLEDFEPFGGRENFDYEMLTKTRDYWNDRFQRDPGIKDVFAKYKALMVQAVEEAEKADFQLSGIMIMLDSGKKLGFFESHMAFVLDSFDWYESAYCGEPYEITEENEFWRADAQTGMVGYGHNPVSDKDHYYLPKFDEDEYGTWFSVWLTRETGQNYNIISIDFNARRVKKLLLMVMTTVAGTIVFMTALSLLIATWKSKVVTRPINELTKGAEEVSKGNYDYEVPKLHDDELGRFTDQFNQMTRDQKKRVNLMETMKKFMGEELAKQAAEAGLYFGGKAAACTVMFTDFAGFSTITRKMTAKDSVDALNEYFNRLIPIIKRYGGFPDKYIGDAIVAIFGAPVELKEDGKLVHAQRAVACAIEMQWMMRKINVERNQSGLPVFEMRIGLNTGEVLVGAIGCDQKLEYTSIGETTNLANRMESICSIGHVMIAERTYEEIKHLFFKGVYINMTPEQVTVKGYPKPVAAYRIWVNNMEIEKIMDSSDPTRKFYKYNEVDHSLKYSPREVEGVVFSGVAQFIQKSEEEESA